MKPKEKAKELFDKMYSVEDMMGNYPMCFETAKQSALRAVDEMLEELSEIVMVTCSSYVIKHIDYWQEVRQEIELL